MKPEQLEAGGSGVKGQPTPPEEGGRAGVGSGQRLLLLGLLSYPLIPAWQGGHWSAGVLAPAGLNSS